MINSILDQDLYKFTMQQAVLELFPDTDVEYEFINRGCCNFPIKAIQELQRNINDIQYVSLTLKEYDWLKEKVPFFKPWYLEYLKTYKFNPHEVKITYTPDTERTYKLSINISGKWHSTILWEVVIMSLLSEIYFNKDYNDRFDYFTINYDTVRDKTKLKAELMNMFNVPFADFGTRRRFSHNVQDCVVETLIKNSNSFVGTSNVYFAMKYNIKPIGTMAHEWIMGNSVLESLRHANYRALDNWNKVYKGDLGIALTDTYTTDAFLNNFNKRFSKEFDGVRHDSGCPDVFAKKMFDHYMRMGVDPKFKTIIFSDALDCQKAVDLFKKYSWYIKCSFGIGTNLTNDVGVTPLNIVIKLSKVNGVPVVKLSDVDGKNTGDPEVIKYTKMVVEGKM